MTKASDLDIARVTELLGRKPQGDFEVVMRDKNDEPIVVKNEPLLFDGTPMPTRYWLVGPKEHMAVSRLESAGFIDLAESPNEAATPIHLGHRLGRNALLVHLRASKRIGVDHMIFNVKYGKRPAGEVLQELAEFVLPEFI